MQSIKFHSEENIIDEVMLRETSCESSLVRCISMFNAKDSAFRVCVIFAINAHVVSLSMRS